MSSNAEFLTEIHNRFAYANDITVTGAELKRLYSIVYPNTQVEKLVHASYDDKQICGLRIGTTVPIFQHLLKTQKIYQIEHLDHFRVRYTMQLTGVPYDDCVAPNGGR